MLVEVTARYPKRKKESELSEEDRALIESNRILDQDYDFEKDENFMYFSYDKLVLNFKDIAEIMRLDQDHVQVNKYNNTSWVIKAPYDVFIGLYTQITGFLIHV